MDDTPMNKLLKILLPICFLLGGLSSLPGAVYGNEDPRVAERRAFVAQMRASDPQQLAQRRRALVASGDSFAQALDLAPDLAVTVVGNGDGDAAATFADLGVIKPTRGGSFALLSTGVAGASQAEPGTDLGTYGEEGDSYALSLQLTLPSGARRVSFDYNFLSAELPDYQGTVFNDAFRVVLVDKFGTREIARASVNSSPFIPASASVAAGSGFDLFTDDPSGVDEVFGAGLPDAGLTRFVTVNAEIRDPATTVTFSIADRGDGVFDSAVLLDNLSFSSLEAVDPIDSMLSGSDVTTDIERLSSGGRAVKAVAADGATRVLLRSQVGGPGAVEMCLDGGSAPDDGGLRLVDGGGRSTCVTAPVRQTSAGFMAFAVYTAPDDFNRGGDASLTKRPLSIRARYAPTGGAAQETTLPLSIVRPPVVLIHGLWSGAGTWSFPLASDPRFRVTRVDYESTHAAFFATNRLAVFSNSGIRQALATDRNQGIAVTQVDVAGHSMGGLLTRIYSASPSYRRNANYLQGDINRLVTLNTPHTGSPLASLLVSLRDSFLIGGPLTSAMAAIGKPIDQGAIDDLAKGSAALSAIGPTELPAHALVGVGGSDALELVPGYIGRVYTIINFFANSSTLFQGLQHDAIVGRQSQEGGLPTSATTVFGGLGSIHTQVTSNNAYSSRLAELLNSKLAGSSFAQLPAVSSTLSAPQSAAAAPAQIAPGAVFTGTLVINDPPAGSVVTPGTTMHVTITPPPAVTLTKVLFVGPDAALADATAPFEADLLVPETAVGDFALRAIGADADGNYYVSQPVTYEAQPNASLTGLTILPREAVLFAAGEQRALTVLGQYSDGITRTLAPGTDLVTFISSAPQFVGVTPEGVMSAAAPGVSTIVAQVAGEAVQDSITARVAPENLAPVARAGQNRIALIDTTVQLDGSASNDPDALQSDALRYEWVQVEGPPVLLSDDTVATPSFTPIVTGTYTFGLVVRDAQSESAPASVRVRVVESNQPPIADAGQHQTVLVGDLVTLNGGGSGDPDGVLGDTLNYHWAQSGGLATPLSGATTAAPTFIPTAAGTYTFTLLVSDTLDTSVPSTVVVTALRRNIAPTASAGTDQRVAVGAVVTLDGSRSADTDLQPGEALTYEWTQTGGAPVALSGATTAKPTFVVPTGGVYTFKLVVRDSVSASQPAVVTVRAAWEVYLPLVGRQ